MANSYPGSWVVKPPSPDLGVPFYITIIFKTGYGASVKQGGKDSASHVPIKLRILASYLPLKSLHFREHPETTPYRQTYSTAHTALLPHRAHSDRCLRQLGGSCTTSFLLWEGTRRVGGCRCWRSMSEAIIASIVKVLDELCSLGFGSEKKESPLCDTISETFRSDPWFHYLCQTRTHPVRSPYYCHNLSQYRGSFNASVGFG